MVLVDDKRARDTSSFCGFISGKELVGIFSFETAFGSDVLVALIFDADFGPQLLSLQECIEVRMTSLRGEFASRHFEVFADDRVQTVRIDFSLSGRRKGEVSLGHSRMWQHF